MFSIYIYFLFDCCQMMKRIHCFFRINELRTTCTHGTVVVANSGGVVSIFIQDGVCVVRKGHNTVLYNNCGFVLGLDFGDEIKRNALS